MLLKMFTYKFIFFALLFFVPSVQAGEYKSLKIRTLSIVPKIKKSKNHKRDILNKINEFVGDDIDLTLFNKHKLGWSVYAKISRVSRLGVRYNY